MKINFQPAASNLIAVSENGSILPEVQVYDGEYLTMPGHPNMVPEGYAFLGWTERSVIHSSARPAQVYALGDWLSIYEKGIL